MIKKIGIYLVNLNEELKTLTVVVSGDNDTIPRLTHYAYFEGIKELEELFQLLGEFFDPDNILRKCDIQ